MPPLLGAPCTLSNFSRFFTEQLERDLFAPARSARSRRVAWVPARARKRVRECLLIFASLAYVEFISQLEFQVFFTFSTSDFEIFSNFEFASFRNFECQAAIFILFWRQSSFLFYFFFWKIWISKLGHWSKFAPILWYRIVSSSRLFPWYRRHTQNTHPLSRLRLVAQVPLCLSFLSLLSFWSFLPSPRLS